MVSFTDQTGWTIELDRPPRRIVSLVPSQTELLFDLGLDDAIVGITRFCVRPADRVGSKTRVGGTKRPDVDVIESLAPDLILGGREENDRKTIQRLRRRYPVWVSDVVSISDALEMIAAVGAVVDRAGEAAGLLRDVRTTLDRVPDFRGSRVAYLIWHRPTMVAGSGTFIHAMLERFRMTNVFAGSARYPEIDLARLRRSRPEWILLSSEPYRFRERDVAEFDGAVSGARAVRVDGQVFSWYGSRLARNGPYLRALHRTLLR